MGHKEDTVLAWHFTGKTLRDGRPIPPVNTWLVHDGPCEMCVSGLHASIKPRDALSYAPGNMVHRVECASIEEQHEDKLLCRKRKILWSADAEETLCEFARWCALQVIDFWEAPSVVVEYMKTGDKSLCLSAAHAARHTAHAAYSAVQAAHAAHSAVQAAHAAHLAQQAGQRASYVEVQNAAADSAFAQYSQYPARDAATYPAAREKQNQKLEELLLKLKN